MNNSIQFAQAGVAPLLRRYTECNPLERSVLIMSAALRSFWGVKMIIQKSFSKDYCPSDNEIPAWVLGVAAVKRWEC